MKKSSRKSSKKQPRNAQAPKLNGTWRIERFPDKNNFPPVGQNDGEFLFDIDNTGKLKNTSKHKFDNKEETIAGKANDNAVRLGHASGKRGYWGVLVLDSAQVMKLAGYYRLQKDIFTDQEQGTWVGTKP